MNRSQALGILAGLLLLVAGCTSPGRDQTQREFERLREHSGTPEEEKILPDFGTDPWTEEALRLLPGSLKKSTLA
jgi:hypothetical protein